ncbi:MAG TPA: Ig-like domain-containing protein [Chryseolinea sp.]|nr:Ig-like domain-containing protein [Chryseolinea sp.]
MNLKRHGHWLIYGLFVLGCARQTSPTGGPKDTIPPILNKLQSNPKNGQTNFKSQQIELAFNESVILNNPKDQIIITPDIRKEYDITAKKNRVIINLKSELEDTTTYAFNFREAIEDITEKNAPPELKLAFSTGSYIDSLSFSGRVFDPITSKEVKELTVAIYQQDTFNIFEHKPVYFSKTNVKGIYTIANLKPGNYRIYAFDDKNKNLIVDSKSELYGFLRDVKRLTTNMKSIAIPVIRLDARPLKLTSARPSGTFFNIKTSKNLKTYRITSPESEPLYSSFGEDNANIRIYNTLIEKDSIPIHLMAMDSIDNAIDTTLFLKFSQRVLRPEAFKTSASTFQVSAHKGTLSGTLQFTKPILHINYDSIFFRIDSLTIIPIQPADLTIDTVHNTINVQKTFNKTLLVQKPPAITSGPAVQDRREAKEKELRTLAKKIRNELYIAPATFISIERDSSAKVTQTIEPSTLETTGVILVQIQTNEPNYIIQLLAKDNSILKQKINTPAATFEDLPPGEYQLRLVIDRDQNQHWSPGNFLKNQEPETIVFYKTEKGMLPINLKANWELGPLLIKF